MRIAGTSYNDSLVNQLNLLASRQYNLQNQISTGQRVQRPEDDPGAMAQGLTLQAESSATAQYAQNISTLQTQANQSYNALQTIKSISDRAGEIATLADGTKTPAELQTYASEVQQLIQQAVQAGNSKNGSQYLFGGTADDNAPFTTTTDADGNITAVSYQGNTDVSQAEIGQATTTTVDVPGANDTGSGPRGLLSDNRYGADLFNHLISLANHLRAGDTNSIASVDHPALTKDEDNIIYHIANNGVTQARLDSASTSASSQLSSVQKSLTSVAGADVTQSIVQLTQTQSTYQAALQSSSVLLQMQQVLLTHLI
jgi:flagellar hook-associated protein 3 FlgL